MKGDFQPSLLAGEEYMMKESNGGGKSLPFRILYYLLIC
jgi:hypothetical protein